MDANQAKTTTTTENPILMQLFVRNLTGETLTLKFTTPYVDALTIKNRIHQITKLPVKLQRLIYSGRQLRDNDVVADRDASIRLVVRGAATKAGQKRTNNFDACRDMSGRRLRHVNAEKKLEEEERKLEKIAEEFIKKKAKTGKKGVGDGQVTKSLEKYREESERCAAIVEEAVKAACGKRKGKDVVKSDDTKRSKIWMETRKMAESDGDSSDDDSDAENEKSVVLNNGNYNNIHRNTHPVITTTTMDANQAKAKTTTTTENPILFQLFVRNLTGETLTLKFTTPYADALTIKNRIHQITKLPVKLQRLIYSGRQLRNNDVVADRDASISLVLPLCGGKGGFGSLLRGAATKAGQKKTNNFDACRDMSGRRLRHVNAEKKLEEWKMEEEERKLEKIAEEFIKKKAKTGKKGVGDGQVTKYLEKYREESERCAAIVKEAVKAACGKRKGKDVVKSDDKKRLKIWMGKRKMAESDEDSSDDDSDAENKKSVVLNNGNNSDSGKETEGSSGSVAGGGKLDGEVSGGGYCESGSEEEKEAVVKQDLELSGANDGREIQGEENRVIEPENHEGKAVETTRVSCLEGAIVSETEAFEGEKLHCSANESMEEVVVQLSSVSSLENGEGNENKLTDANANGYSDSKSVAHEEEMVASTTNTVEPEKPLNFDDFNSAAEMEVLGMERLKFELQAHGLKCGGTLQERAARLFLLKSIPLDKLPKKLLAKK